MRGAIFICTAVLLSLACAGRAGQRGTAAGAGAPESLPRHLTVELHADGSLELDGKGTSLERLQAELDSAWKTGQFAHVLLWADAGTAQASAQRVLEVFFRAGIEHWRFAWRAGPTVAPVAPAAPAVAHAPEAPALGPVTPAQAEPDAVESKVNLKTIGLHLGGGPKDEATRKTIIQLFEAKFPEIQRCAHGLSPLPTQLTSFGVDLYVGAQGGKAQAREVRTRLGPEAFKSCMKAVLTAIEFPAPDKPLVISYSLGFSPVSGG